jgi:hypothetical protein
MTERIWNVLYWLVGYMLGVNDFDNRASRYFDSDASAAMRRRWSSPSIGRDESLAIMIGPAPETGCLSLTSTRNGAGN